METRTSRRRVKITHSEDLDSKKKTIQEMGLKAIQDYFSIDVNSIDKNTIAHLHNKAKIGMQFEREMSVSNRAVELNYIRVFRMIAEDKKELRKFIKLRMPKYNPI